MQILIDTAQSSGQLRDANDVCLVVEFHARSKNADSVYVGKSGVSSSKGRELPPGESYTLNFALPDLGRHAGSVLLSSFYVSLSGTDKLDWSAILR